MRARSTAIIVAIALALLGGGVVWWQRHQAAETAKTHAAQAAVTALAERWQAGDVTTVPFADPSVADAFEPTLAGLGKTAVRITPSTVSRTDDAAHASLEVAWQVVPEGAWTYTVPVTLAYAGGAWTISPPAAADTSFWVPGIPADGTISVTRTHGTRGEILGRDGKPLMPMGTVYPVQLDPTRANAATATGLEQVTGESGLVAKLAAAQKAGSKAPIPVITYRQSDFEQRRQALDALKGVIYPRTEQPLAPTRTFGQPLLGSFGDVTAEMIDKGQARYVAGDRAGLSGLQGQYDAALGGDPGVQVVTGEGPTLLWEHKATDGTDITTTLDVATQQAAEAAVAKTGKVPSALVAIDVKTGHTLAVANNPSFGFDRALTGQYPPGSTMKVATTYALLTSGVLTPTTRVSCPATVVVDGKTFRNFEGETLGNPTFAEDFAHSCNTAFVQEAAKLPDSGVADAAQSLGIGRDWAKTFGATGTYAGSVPEANGATDKVAGAIGQGRDLASPVSMATLAASIARGSYLPSRLVIDAAAAAPTAEALDAKAVAQIRTMMGSVVTQGTASVMRGTPGGAVYGKTGTAEYGTSNPPKNRVWFIGWQGTVAFAVLVEDGNAGGAVAAPIAKAFLTALNAG
ncbi:MAG: penicillin-binding transpeptidase domain-containing protein [Nostocoides sp.]